MGKGRIVTDHGDGLYTIELLEDRVRAETSRTLAAQRVASLDDRIADLEVDLAAAQVQVDSAADEQDQAIAAYKADPTSETRAAMTAAGEAVIQAAAKRDAIAGNIRALKTERLALQRRIDRIDALPALRQQQAWCGDLTESLAGEVGTAEVPGQAQQVLVHPGHEGAAVYDQARDGALQPALSGTPASVYYNLAMLPGWQKWRPTYRIANITSLSTSADSCDIDIEPATSSEQDLNVNAEASYASVPIQYMTCHANAFEVGDRVLVRFDRQDQSPTVIGFEANPRGCGIDTVVAVPISLYYDVTQAFLSGSECACSEATPTPGEVYSQFAAIKYAWNVEFTEMLVYQQGKLAQALNASDFAGLPAADATLSESIELPSLNRPVPAYNYDFPYNNGGVCETQQVGFTRLAVTAFDPAPDPFFNGEVIVSDANAESINLEGETFSVVYSVPLRRQEYDSTEHGPFTTANDGTECTAEMLLSKTREEMPSLDTSYGTIGLDDFPEIEVAGKLLRPLGVFGVIEGDPVYSRDLKRITIGFQEYAYSDRLTNLKYLLVGYGR